MGTGVGGRGKPGATLVRLGLFRLALRGTGVWRTSFQEPTSTAGHAHWLLVRRSASDPTERAYYRVYAPVDTPMEQIVRVAGQRWCIESAFEEAKGLVGLDQYEVRKWDAWHRHITLALLAHAALVVTRTQAAEAEEKGGC